MRIALLAALVFLSACAETPKKVDPIVARPDLHVAMVQCLSRGYVRGSYEFDVCYRNRSEVQYYERRARLMNLAILSSNRSPRRSGELSYPVE